MAQTVTLVALTTRTGLMGRFVSKVTKTQLISGL
jgi:hypothetical protein